MRDFICFIKGRRKRDTTQVVIQVCIIGHPFSGHPVKKVDDDSALGESSPGDYWVVAQVVAPKVDQGFSGGIEW